MKIALLSLCLVLFMGCTTGYRSSSDVAFAREGRTITEIEQQYGAPTKRRASSDKIVYVYDNSGIGRYDKKCFSFTDRKLVSWDFQSGAC